MKNKIFTFILFTLTAVTISAQTEKLNILPGFSNSPYFNEQIKTFNIYSDVRVQINAPSADKFDPAKPVQIIIFALPNGNTIEQTVGKVLQPGDDWHFDIQHIGAQTRFVREHILDYNSVTVYFEAAQKSWPAWKSAHSDFAELIPSFVDSVENIFSNYETFVVLNGHSGGGRFIFSYLDGYETIPSKVKRISFLDSDYGYENYYGDKIINWLNASEENVLCVIAYNDSVALYNGEPIVSATGGTWYRSRMMKNYMSSYFDFTNEEDDDFIRHTALNGRIKFYLKKNPLRQILHTVQVERNGFIQSMSQATAHENEDYNYYGARAYTDLIQSSDAMPAVLNIPPRAPDAKTGSEFMRFVLNMTFEQREVQILNEIKNGNIPNFLRSLINIEKQFTDVNGNPHTVVFQAMPDYLAIGSNEDFCRIPMGPITAQKLADLFGATMPTRKLVDNIYTNCTVKLQPVTYTPVGNANELVPKFILHNLAIDSLRILAVGELGELIGGTKKDVVISNKIVDPTRPDHVVIYGWHQLNGQPIQPLTNIHINWYVDYSHGVRFLNNEILLDGEIASIRDILQDDVLYKILSDESAPMEQPSYLKIAGLPDKPKSFGVKTGSADEIEIIIKPDSNVETYLVQTSTDGVNFNEPIERAADNLKFGGLEENTIYYFRLKAKNSLGESAYSEVLSGVTSSNLFPGAIIVNGFDRASDGNTFNFVRQHSAAMEYANIDFCSATNDAVTDGLFLLTNYKIADYILGDESTADETFSSFEQSIVVEFLQNGGYLFVSGSKIGWDLDYKGASLDKTFIREYLKAGYAADAPNNTSNTYYNANPVNGTFMDSIPQFSFDNGTHGTINVDWPDVLIPVNGASGLLQYTGLSTSSGFAGIYFEGDFPGGSSPGKVITMGIPFETIYPEASRNSIMKSIIDFFDTETGIENEADDLPKSFSLSQNYPNPFNPSTVIQYSIPAVDALSAVEAPQLQHITLKIYDILGREITTLVNEAQQAGNYSITFNSAGLSSGVYIYKLSAGNFNSVKKMILQK